FNNRQGFEVFDQTRQKLVRLSRPKIRIPVSPGSPFTDCGNIRIQSCPDDVQSVRSDRDSVEKFHHPGLKQTFA
ncbi:MAG: hypothetical protein U1E27_12025, partial [Kiritimatiellia bacterium]|nr:hypothetical protein [Kiritimatiellia bacterium]